MLTLTRRESLWGLAFIAPWIVGAMVFTLLPMGASFVISLTNFDPRYPDAVQVVGFANYQRMFTDPLVLQSLGVTLKFAAVMLPLTLGVSLGLAMLVNHPRLLGRSVFRTLFYMPTQIPIVATTLIWQGVLNLHTGWLNFALGAVGIAGPDWLNSTAWVYPGLSLISLWGTGTMMLIALAGLQSVPTELYEAAKIDGAGRWAQFRNVTIPMVSPVLFYNLIIALIGTFQYFTQAYVLTNGRGDPDNATLFFNLNLYREGWRYYEMGYAATLAWLLFVIVLVLTVILFRTRSRWVYEGSAR
ncbi:MAG TPA: sugar ABC transporter permease [Candidatus Limnocylindria bacterium]|nr:sugar ABC transporter permease [Candidatus Limnocylindria bacterium]